MKELKENSAILYVAATHIGLIDDIPSRSLEILRTANLLIFEEDRPARQMLKAAGVHRDYEKYSEHKESETLALARKTWKAKGTVSYMSDQGTAGLADPGRELVNAAYDMNVVVKVIPGPSSVTAAISACPFDCKKFQFAGFPPRKESLRHQFLKDVGDFPQPSILMDTPYRLKPLLEACQTALPKRRMFLAIDITGANEAYYFGSPAKILEKAQALEEKLNFVLIIDKQ